MENSLLTFAVDLREDVQRVRAEGRLDAGKPIPDYSADVMLEHVDIAPWLNKRSRLTDVSGRVRLQGSGSNARNADVQVAARLDRSTVLTYAIDRATVRGRYRPDSLTAEIDITGPYGNAVVSAAAGGRRGPAQGFRLGQTLGVRPGPAETRLGTRVHAES